MADEQFALSPSVTPLPTEADYQAIFATVMETMRGRWFLAEYGKRNRNTDNEAILAALTRVEAAVRETRPAAAPPASPAERVRTKLLEMAKAIDRTRSEIASIKPEGDHKGPLLEATEELYSIVLTTERATSDILAAAEHVQEIAWTLREHGTDCDSCDALDRRAADIYTACSFQDFAKQRTRKVVEVLRFLEARIKSMIETWGDTDTQLNGAVALQIHDAPGAEHLDQPYNDEMMPRVRAPQPADGVDPSRLEPAVEPAEAEVVESCAPEGREPEHAEPAKAAPTAPETVDPELAGRAEPHSAEAVHAEQERAAAERLKPSEPGFHYREAAPPSPDRLEPEKNAPQSIIERNSEAAAPENPSCSDPAAVLERILAIIHEPIEAAELSVVGPPPAGQERAADCDDRVTPLTLGVTPSRAAAPADLGVPSPDYSFAASPDRDVATPAPSATLAGIEDIPFASYSRPGPLTVADVVDEMLADVPVEMASLGSAGPAAGTVPLESPFVRLQAMAAPSPLPMPMPPAMAEPFVAPQWFARPEPFAKQESVANPERNPDQVCEPERIVKAELAITAEPIAEPAPIAKAEPIAKTEPILERVSATAPKAAAAPIEPAPAVAAAPPREEPA